MVALTGHVEFEGHAVLDAANVADAGCEALAAGCEAVDGEGTVVDDVRVEFLGRLAARVARKDGLLSRARNGLASLRNQLLVGVGAHIVRKGLVHLVLGRRDARTGPGQVGGQLRLLRGARNIVGVVDLEAGGGGIGSRNAWAVQVNGALLDGRAGDVLGVPDGDHGRAALVANRGAGSANVAHGLGASRGPRGILKGLDDEPCVGGDQVGRHDALGRLGALVGADLVRGLAIVCHFVADGLGVIRRHVGVTVGGAAVLLRHGVAVRARHVGLAEILGLSGTDVRHRGLGTGNKGHDLDGTGLALDETAVGDEEALAGLVNVKAVRAVLADLSWVVGICGDKGRSGHDGGLVRLFGIGGHTELVRVLGAHDFVDFELLEAAFAEETKLFADARADVDGLKGALAVARNGILDTALEKVGIVLHAKGVAIGGAIRLKHVFNFALLELGGAGAIVGVKGCRILAGRNVLLDAASEEGYHVVVLVFVRGNALSGQGADDVLAVHVVGVLFHAVTTELDHGPICLERDGVWRELAGTALEGGEGGLLRGVAEGLAVGSRMRFRGVGLAVGVLKHLVEFGTKADRRGAFGGLS